MLRKLTILTLAATLVLAGTSSAFARGPRGGGWGGGGRVGGWSGGRGYVGGYRGGYGYRNNGWGGFGTGLAIGAGLGYVGGNGYYPYGYHTGVYYNVPDYYSTAPVYADPGYTNSVIVPNTTYASPAASMDMGYTSVTQPNNTARINIHVPSNARVYFGNTEAYSPMGSERHFVSPALDPGSDYQYELRAQWMENGQMVDRTRIVAVHANDVVNVDFMRQ